MINIATEGAWAPEARVGKVVFAKRMKKAAQERDHPGSPAANTRHSRASIPDASGDGFTVTHIGD